MAERFRELAAEWGLAELPDYLARVALPLFDENDPQRRRRGLHVVHGDRSMAVGMLERESQRGLLDSGRQTRVLLASLGVGRVTVERHIGLGLGNYLRCADSCYVRIFTGTAVTGKSFGAPQEYDIEPHTNDATANVQYQLVADLTLLAMASPDQDLFSGGATAQGSFASMSLLTRMDQHTFQPELEAARAQLHMPHAS